MIVRLEKKKKNDTKKIVFQSKRDLKIKDKKVKNEKKKKNGNWSRKFVIDLSHVIFLFCCFKKC